MPRDRNAEPPPVPLLGVGHSNRSLEGFLALLAAHDVGALADVRAFPASRAHPHFAREPLAASLAGAGVRYVWVPELGGRRRPPPGPPRSGGWTEAGFQAYEAHMTTGEFARGLALLLETARAAAPAATAFMCSEARWWGCHRSMVADALAACGVPVAHLTERGAVPHPFDERRDRYAPGVLRRRGA